MRRINKFCSYLKLASGRINDQIGLEVVVEHFTRFYEEDT